MKFTNFPENVRSAGPVPTPVAIVEEDQIHLVPSICKVGRDASHGSRAVVVPMIGSESSCRILSSTFAFAVYYYCSFVIVIGCCEWYFVYLSCIMMFNAT